MRDMTLADLAYGEDEPAVDNPWDINDGDWGDPVILPTEIAPSEHDDLCWVACPHPVKGVKL